MSNEARKFDEFESTHPESDDSSERRTHADSKKRDRRVIARLSDPTARHFLGWIQKFCSAWIVMTAVFLGAYLALELSRGPLERNRAIFFTMIAAFLMVVVHRFGSSVRSFLENESQERILRVFERAYHLCFVLLILSGVFVVGMLGWLA